MIQVITCLVPSSLSPSKVWDYLCCLSLTPLTYLSSLHLCAFGCPLPAATTCLTFQPYPMLLWPLHNVPLLYWLDPSFHTIFYHQKRPWMGINETLEGRQTKALAVTGTKELTGPWMETIDSVWEKSWLHWHKIRWYKRRLQLLQ